MAYWETRPLSEVCEIKPTKSKAKAMLTDEDEVSFVPMEDMGIGVKHLNASRTRRLGEVFSSYTYFADGDVLLAKITPCFENGKLGIARDLMNGVGFGSSEYIVFRPSPSLDAEFLYYYLTRQKFRDEGVRTMTGAVGHKRVSKDFVESYLIRVPPLSEQRRIVEILDEISDSIDVAKNNTSKNLSNGRELFESFLQNTFTQKESEWEETTLGEVCKFVGGSQPPKSEFISEYRDDLVRLIQIRDYKSDKHIVYIPKALAKRSCTADDVMIGRYGPPVFQILRGLTGSYNVALMKAVPDARRLSKDFLFYFLKHKAIQSFIINASSRAAGQSGLNKDTIEPYPIAFPTLTQQAQIVSKIRSLEEALSDLELASLKKLAALDQLRESVLYQAFNGHLTVAKAAEEMEAVA